MTDYLVSKDKWNELQNHIEKLVGSLNYNPTEDRIHVHTITDEKTYKDIKKIAKELGIKDSIEIEKPREDYMKEGYQITIVRK